jgi:hypothetical protein
MSEDVAKANDVSGIRNAIGNGRGDVAEVVHVFAADLEELQVPSLLPRPDERSSVGLSLALSSPLF